MIFNTNLFTSGAKVCLSDINEKLGEESLRELSQQFGEDVVAFQVCDVTKEDSVKRLIEEAERKLNSPLYCFINNAGIRLYPGAPLNWTPRIPKYGDDGVSDQSVSGVMGEKEGWRLCMDINLTGVLHGTNLAMRWKIRFSRSAEHIILIFSKMDFSAGGGGGRIVNIASILGLFCAQQPKGTE